MKTNWRRLGDILADVTSSRESLRAAAGDGAKPEMSGDRPLEEGGPGGRSPTRAVEGPRDGNGKRSRSQDQWTVRPPAVRRSPKAPAASKEHVKEPSPTENRRPALPQRVIHGGKCGCVAIAPDRLSPAGATHPHLALDGEDHQRSSPVSQSGSTARPARIARHPRMQMAAATTSQTAKSATTATVVSALMPAPACPAGG